MKKKTLLSLSLLFVFVLTFSFVFTSNVLSDSIPANCCHIDETAHCSAGAGKWIPLNDKDPGTDYICVYTGTYLCEVAPNCW